MTQKEVLGLLQGLPPLTQGSETLMRMLKHNLFVTGGEKDLLHTHHMPSIHDHTPENIQGPNLM